MLSNHTENPSPPGGRAPADASFAAVDTRRSPFRMGLLIAGVGAYLVLLDACFRAALIGRTFHHGEATVAELVWSFIVGARFDVAATSYLLIPVTLLAFLPWTSPAAGSLEARRRFCWMTTLLLAPVQLLSLAELEFFNEFHARFNQLAVRYLDQPGTVGGMIWYNYPVVRYLLAWGAIVAITYLALTALATALFATIRADRVARRPSRAYVLEWAATATCIGILIGIGARGGLGGTPLRWGHAFRGDNEYANQMSLNGLWTLGQAVSSEFGRHSVSRQWTASMDQSEARQIVRELLVSDTEQLVNPSDYTVLRTGAIPSSLHLRHDPARPPNVVFVLMESFSARFVGATGAARSFTPNFDALAKQGVLFDRCFSAGSHTHQGIFASTLGFPNLPGYDALMQSSAANQPFESIFDIFSEGGYQTLLLYNGNLEWDNMRGFFQKQGVSSFVGGEDIPGARYRDAVWGVSDGDLFDEANNRFEKAAKNGPFVGMIITLSNHAPFQVPQVPGLAPVTDMGEYNARLSAMQYADWAIGQFIADARKREYFNNTLFVFVGDHGFHVDPVLTEVHLLYHHVPLLFYAPGLTDVRGVVDHRIATQMNILPSILGILGITGAPQASWARSLFDPASAAGQRDEVGVFKLSGGGSATAIVRGDKLLVFGSEAGGSRLMTWDLGPEPSVKPYVGPDAGAIRDDMQKTLRAYVQAALADLTSHRAGIPPKPVSLTANAPHR